MYDDLQVLVNGIVATGAKAFHAGAEPLPSVSTGPADGESPGPGPDSESSSDTVSQIYLTSSSTY